MKNRKRIAAAVAIIVVLLAVVLIVRGNRQSNTPVDTAPTATVETTEAPTEEPTEEPTAEPTEEPTEAPTEESTAEPTEEPTAEPTEEPTGEPTEEPTAEPTAMPVSDEDMLVLVNGSAINRGSFNTYLASVTNYFAQYGYTVTEDLQPEFNELAMDAAIEEELMRQYAVDHGLDQLTDEERTEIETRVSTQWAQVVDQYVMTYGGVTEESTEEEIADARLNVLALLESLGYTEQSLVDAAVENAMYNKVYDAMTADVTVSDEDIQAAFDAHVSEDQAAYENDIGTYEYMTQYYGQTSYYTPSGYRGVTHILLPVEQTLLDTWQSLSAKLEEQQEAAENPEPTAAPDAEAADEPEATAEPTEEPVTQEQVDAAYAAIIASVQPTIDEIYQKLEEGVPFADLVAEYGTDPGMQSEPNKTDGYPVHLDSIIWDPAFVAGAFSVDEVGEVAQPVVGSYGVHIIQYTRDVPAGPVELTDELRATISEELLSEKQNARYSEVMAEWKDNAEIVYSAIAEAMLPPKEEVAE